MESSKSLVLIVSLSCLLLSGINAVPITRSRGLEEEAQARAQAQAQAPAAAPAPSDDVVDVRDVDVNGFVRDEVNKAGTKYAGDLVDLCKDGENVKLCMETLAPVVHGALDPVLALVTEIGITLNETQKVAKIIEALKGDPKTPKGITEALDICAEQYESIVDTINKSLEMIHQNDVYGAWMRFSAVISCQSTCEDAFKESPGEPFPFADDSKTLFQLGGNCLAILMRLSGETSPYKD